MTQPKKRPKQSEQPGPPPRLKPPPQLSLFDDGRDDSAAGADERDQVLRRIADRYPGVVTELHRYLRSLYDDRRRERERAGAWHGPAVYVDGDDATLYLERTGFLGDRRVIGVVLNPRAGWRYVGRAPTRIKRRHARSIVHWAPADY